MAEETVDNCEELMFIFFKYNKLLEDHVAIIETIKRLKLDGYLSRNMKKETGKSINWNL